MLEKIGFYIENLIRGYIDFIKSPKLISRSQKPFRKKMIDLVILTLFLVFVAFGLGIIIQYINEAVVDLGEHATERLQREFDIWEVAIIAIVIAPLLENTAIFLAVTRFNLKLIFISLILITAFFIPLPEAPTIALLLTLLVLYVYLTRAKKELLTKAEEVWNKRFNIVFYLSVLIFGYIHIFNYEARLDILLLSPILILPQLFVGGAFGYIRLKYGFWMSVVLHGMYNGVLFLPLLVL